MLCLKEIRKSNGMSQQQLAEKLGVTQATLSGWENEKYEIDNASLLKCANIFNVSVDYLLGGNIELEEIKKARARTKELHEANDIPTKQTIEEKTGTNYHTFRAWCNGYGDYFNDKLYIIADLFNVSVDYLLGRENKLANSELENNLNENVVIYSRNGKTIKKEFTKKEMDAIAIMLESLKGTQYNDDL